MDDISFKLGKIPGFFRDKKFTWGVVIFLLLAIIIFSSSMRLQNLDILKDQTTGEYIPTALDPFYFLRIAETIHQQGSLPEVDSMRYIPLKLGFSHEIMPHLIILIYQIIKPFNSDATVAFADVISPVIIFAFGLVLFFLFIYSLTKSKITALLSVAFLSVTPPYLYRTLAGFSDHEPIGMFSFFLAMFCYTLILDFFDKKETYGKVKPILFGLLLGALAAFTKSSWGGISSFTFIIIPLSFFIFWILKFQNVENLNKNKIFSYLLFYISWFISGILFIAFYGFSFTTALNTATLSTSSMINGAVLLFSIIDGILILKRDFLSGKIRKYRIFASIVLLVILGFIILFIIGKNPFSLFYNVLGRLINPFGAGRTGLTVAENAQTSITQLTSQIGKIFFWLFYLGLILTGFELSKGISKKRSRILFILAYAFMISGILFNKISDSSLFNGTNLISHLFYFSGLILFFGYSIKLYLTEEIKIDCGLIIIFSWLFFMTIAGSGAVRLFFVIIPAVVFMACYFTVKMFEYYKKTKDEFSKLIIGVVLILSVIGLIFSGISFTNDSSLKAKQTGPSATSQWQNAMKWVRENTQEGSIFLHWWDYGYWVQYLGQRPTVTDGGHGNDFWDHLVGRYVLTTPSPETALSFMEAQNVSYLLIDPTDLGKYPAYSKIGSDNSGEDRFAQIPVMLVDNSKTQTSENKTTKIYQGGVLVDKDIIYKNDDGTTIFLPQNKAVFAGVMIRTNLDSNRLSFLQPYGIYVYNQQQISLPLRYIYYQNKIIDFGGGLDGIAMIIPAAGYNSNQIQIDNTGALIYLSPKTSKSLFAQLYLLDDAFGNYKTLKIAHTEEDSAVTSLKSQGGKIGEFLYFQGFRGPIKIWKISYPEDIIAREEFTNPSGEYAEFDDLQFVR